MTRDPLKPSPGRCLFMGRHLYSDHEDLVEYMRNWNENQLPLSVQTREDIHVYHHYETSAILDREIPADKLEAFNRGKAALMEKDNLFERRFPGIRSTASQACRAFETKNKSVANKIVYLNGMMQAWGKPGTIPSEPILNMETVELQKPESD